MDAAQYRSPQCIQRPKNTRLLLAAEESMRKTWSSRILLRRGAMLKLIEIRNREVSSAKFRAPGEDCGSEPCCLRHPLLRGRTFGCVTSSQAPNCGVNLELAFMSCSTVHRSTVLLEVLMADNLGQNATTAAPFAGRHFGRRVQQSTGHLQHAIVRPACGSQWLAYSSLGARRGTGYALISHPSHRSHRTAANFPPAEPLPICRGTATIWLR